MAEELPTQYTPDHPLVAELKQRQETQRVLLELKGRQLVLAALNGDGGYPTIISADREVLVPLVDKMIEDEQRRIGQLKALMVEDKIRAKIGE